MVLSLQSRFESQMGSGVREVSCSGFGSSKKMKWSDLLSSKANFTPEPLPFVSPGLVEGSKMMGFSDEEIAEDVRRCEDLVVGCFVGKILSFLQVKNTVHRVWNLKGKLKMTLHGDNIFVFEFDSEANRMTTFEHGCFFISGQLFVVRSWSLMIEQDLYEPKSLPIWINIRDVPLHLWHPKVLGKLARFVGVPVMLDK